uniref:Uncharacterized protein n=1 Tax=Chromera velia CCMP2878 TaxID=1169474 RepID=A0A0G4FBQ1_9ALVE|eukprot:Cvel_16159.t1-p1 / transcript=Cvel_16159.t1 / gene=Cvel_16159 / organism=Chromera_velia_CCMP2878 / gene_product=hypothetical protein / transcript_product=hypothetical protein / location=Cvel_scaffold1231:30360-37251(-) / protein_length=2026 / sequence_SO=supercontig / SO=protein_coding / is_pseudo=false
MKKADVPSPAEEDAHDDSCASWGGQELYAFLPADLSSDFLDEQAATSLVADGRIQLADLFNRNKQNQQQNDLAGTPTTTTGGSVASSEQRQTHIFFGHASQDDNHLSQTPQDKQGEGEGRSEALPQKIAGGAGASSSSSSGSSTPPSDTPKSVDTMRLGRNPSPLLQTKNPLPLTPNDFFLHPHDPLPPEGSRKGDGKPSGGVFAPSFSSSRPSTSSLPAVEKGKETCGRNVRVLRLQVPSPIPVPSHTPVNGGVGVGVNGMQHRHSAPNNNNHQKHEKASSVSMGALSLEPEVPLWDHEGEGEASPSTPQSPEYFLPFPFPTDRGNGTLQKLHLPPSSSPSVVPPPPPCPDSLSDKKGHAWAGEPKTAALPFSSPSPSPHTHSVSPAPSSDPLSTSAYVPPLVLSAEEEALKAKLSSCLEDLKLLQKAARKGSTDKPPTPQSTAELLRKKIDSQNALFFSVATRLQKASDVLTQAVTSFPLQKQDRLRPSPGTATPWEGGVDVPSGQESKSESFGFSNYRSLQLSSSPAVPPGAPVSGWDASTEFMKKALLMSRKEVSALTEQASQGVTKQRELQARAEAAELSLEEFKQDRLRLEEEVQILRLRLEKQKEPEGVLLGGRSGSIAAPNGPPIGKEHLPSPPSFSGGKESSRPLPEGSPSLPPSAPHTQSWTPAPFGPSLQNPTGGTGPCPLPPSVPMPTSSQRPQQQPQQLQLLTRPPNKVQKQPLSLVEACSLDSPTPSPLQRERENLNDSSASASSPSPSPSPPANLMRVLHGQSQRERDLHLLLPPHPAAVPVPVGSNGMNGGTGNGSAPMPLSHPSSSLHTSRELQQRIAPPQPPHIVQWNHQTSPPHPVTPAPGPGRQEGDHPPHLRDGKHVYSGCEKPTPEVYTPSHQQQQSPVPMVSPPPPQPVLVPVGPPHPGKLTSLLELQQQSQGPSNLSSSQQQQPNNSSGCSNSNRKVFLLSEALSNSPTMRGEKKETERSQRQQTGEQQIETLLDGGPIDCPLESPCQSPPPHAAMRGQSYPPFLPSVPASAVSVSAAVMQSHSPLPTAPSARSDTASPTPNGPALFLQQQQKNDPGVAAEAARAVAQLTENIAKSYLASLSAYQGAVSPFPAAASAKAHLSGSAAEAPTQQQAKTPAPQSQPPPPPGPPPMKQGRGDGACSRPNPLVLPGGSFSRTVDEPVCPTAAMGGGGPPSQRKFNVRGGTLPSPVSGDVSATTPAATPSPSSSPDFAAFAFSPSNPVTVNGQTQQACAVPRSHSVPQPMPRHSLNGRIPYPPLGVPPPQSGDPTPISLSGSSSARTGGGGGALLLPLFDPQAQGGPGSGGSQEDPERGASASGASESHATQVPLPFSAGGGGRSVGSAASDSGSFASGTLPRERSVGEALCVNGVKVMASPKGLQPSPPPLLPHKPPLSQVHPNAHVHVQVLSAPPSAPSAPVPPVGPKPSLLGVAPATATPVLPLPPPISSHRSSDKDKDSSSSSRESRTGTPPSAESGALFLKASLSADSLQAPPAAILSADPKEKRPNGKTTITPTPSWCDVRVATEFVPAVGGDVDRAAVYVLAFGQERIRRHFIMLACGTRNGQVTLHRIYRTPAEVEMAAEKARVSRGDDSYPIDTQGGQRDDAWVWDVARNSAESSPVVSHARLTGHARCVTGLVFFPPGREDRLASGSIDSTMKIWRVDNGTLLQTVNCRDHVLCFSMLPSTYPNHNPPKRPTDDRVVFAIGTKKDKMRLLEVNSSFGAVVLKLKLGGTPSALAVATGERHGPLPTCFSSSMQQTPCAELTPEMCTGMRFGVELPGLVFTGTRQGAIDVVAVVRNGGWKQVVAFEGGLQAGGDYTMTRLTSAEISVSSAPVSDVCFVSSQKRSTGGPPGARSLSPLLLVSSNDHCLTILSVLVDPRVSGGAVEETGNLQQQVLMNVQLQPLQKLQIHHAVHSLRSCFVSSWHSGQPSGFVVSGSEDSRVQVFGLTPGVVKTSEDTRGPRRASLVHHRSPVLAVAVSDTESLLVSTDTTGTAVLWRRGGV